MNRPRYWLCRLYNCGSIAVTAGIALLDQTSKHHASVSSDGFDGQLALGLLLGFCALGVLDTLNDFVPRMLRVRALREHRWLIFIGLSGGQACMILPNLFDGQVEPFLARYVLDAGVALAVACFDMRLQWDNRRKVAG